MRIGSQDGKITCLAGFSHAAERKYETALLLTRIREETSPELGIGPIGYSQLDGR